MKREKLGMCPLCDTTIYTDQHTVWRLVEGAPARVHGTCLTPPVTRRKVLA